MEEIEMYDKIAGVICSENGPYKIFEVHETFRYDPQKYDFFGLIVPKMHAPFVHHYLYYRHRRWVRDAFETPCQRKIESLEPLRIDRTRKDLPRLMRTPGFCDDIYTFNFQKFPAPSPSEGDIVELFFNPFFRHITREKQKETREISCKFPCIPLVCLSCACQCLKCTNIFQKESTYERDPKVDLFHIILKAHPKARALPEPETQKSESESLDAKDPSDKSDKSEESAPESDSCPCSAEPNNISE